MREDWIFFHASPVLVLELMKRVEIFVFEKKTNRMTNFSILTLLFFFFSHRQLINFIKLRFEGRVY